MAFTLRERRCGVLLHPTSLPGPHGLGDLGPQAEAFARWLADAGQGWWQTLPVVPPDSHGSPYAALSAMAGSPSLVSLYGLLEDGLLGEDDAEAVAGLDTGRAEPVDAELFRAPRLRRACEAFFAREGCEDLRAFEAFRVANRDWLEDWVLFSAIRRAQGGRSWIHWPEPLRRREPGALRAARFQLGDEVRMAEFLQFQFDRQWTRLRELCASLGIGLIGDLPIFVAHDSADVWAHPELFALDAAGRPLFVAGVPPDYFSATGQLWGNPVYRWGVLQATGYAWWVERFRSAFSRFDAVRLDHFIGFHNYWEVPAGERTAMHGRWLPGPGEPFFRAVFEKLGPLELIAEDLGVVTGGVKALREKLGLPGIKVLLMGFGTEPDAESHRPRSHPRRCVAYTGTHDTDTVDGWLADEGGPASTRSPEQVAAEHAALREYLGASGAEAHWEAVRAVLESPADTAIVPVQDLLGLGSEARMNLPGTVSGNWRWRLAEGRLAGDLGERLRGLTAAAGRLGAVLSSAGSPGAILPGDSR